ncbi:MAG TPA: 6,7-dimethyl-8-ribityllumazine synthase [Bacteroidales bacterium]|nr:MAG: 6,7-dimethyl-8-ribityllumazine synthase [Bacteroidetes bacterium ADurb.Bin217]HOS85306.1 6,7-dimethyl-8-ribityllumazine synthase [Bacteroidales bacterium]HPH16350.1 6,7-dimethyl-8-ribityllumazine synthase [Bacteroidales bacterium]HPM13423.1 6,7-dimethyl-8-ribityllumazine synthase [Bacteroidales bacterium]
MATSLKNLSDYDFTSIPDASGLSIGIVVAEWNIEINNQLLQGAIETLLHHGVDKANIFVNYVPGAFELTYGCKVMAENYDVDAIIAIGTVIQGDTPHFDYICQGVTYGISELNLSFDLPFIFGVLTVNSLEQAQERAGGKHGNKGVEAAVTAIKMGLYN